jgi:succinoglycan biosynthesis transport protein ExoP
MTEMKRLNGSTRSMEAMPGVGLGPVGGTGRAGAGDAEHESPLAMLMKVHRALRGRYKYAIPLAAVCGLAGAVGGFLSTQPMYECRGQIRFQRNTLSLNDKGYDPSQNYFGGFVNTQAKIIQSPSIIRTATGSDLWRGAGGENTPEAREEFEEKLLVTVDQKTNEWIDVRYPHRDPKIATVAVKQVIEAYQEYWRATQGGSTHQIQFLEDQKKNKERQLQTVDQDIMGLTEPYSTKDLRSLHASYLKELTELDREHRDLSLALAERIAQDDLAAKKEGQPGGGAMPGAIAGQDITPMQIARVDPGMADLLNMQRGANLRLQQLKATKTSKHPAVIKAQNELDVAQAEIERYADEWRAANPGGIPAIGMTLAVEKYANMTREELETKMGVLKAKLDDQHTKTQRLNRDAQQLEALERKQKDIMEEIDKHKRQIRELEFQTAAEQELKDAGRVQFVSTGEEPVSPAYDNRVKYALAGSIAGAGLPLLGFLLWGIADRRFRYSDDSMSSKQPITLLGILPSLPDNMTDPEQAGIAAHCVHQIRTLLQLGAHHDRGAQIFAVTSPTSGDGKTSLSMSLGMSFAASGSRTLMVDFDMIGRGLTRNMNAKTDRGTMAAVDAGEIEPYIVPTAFKRLSLLPTAEDDAQEVGRLSPPSVRRLLEQTRHDYDVVVVDTGPILGSLEACMVAAQVDGVVLCMGRGQQKSLAERAIQQLQSVGAKLLGVVFNKADASDFKRSVSSASIRSVPASPNALALSTTAPRASKMGPVAKVVAATMGHEPEGGHGEGRNQHAE